MTSRKVVSIFLLVVLVFTTACTAEVKDGAADRMHVDEPIWIAGNGDAALAMIMPNGSVKQFVGGSHLFLPHAVAPRGTAQAGRLYAVTDKGDVASVDPDGVVNVVLPSKPGDDIRDLLVVPAGSTNAGTLVIEHQSGELTWIPVQGEPYTTEARGADPVSPLVVAAPAGTPRAGAVSVLWVNPSGVGPETMMDTYLPDGRYGNRGIDAPAPTLAAYSEVETSEGGSLFIGNFPDTLGGVFPLPGGGRLNRASNTYVLVLSPDGATSTRIDLDRTGTSFSQLVPLPVIWPSGESMIVSRVEPFSEFRRLTLLTTVGVGAEVNLDGKVNVLDIASRQKIAVAPAGQPDASTIYVASSKSGSLFAIAPGLDPQPVNVGDIPNGVECCTSLVAQPAVGGTAVIGLGKEGASSKVLTWYPGARTPHVQDGPSSTADLILADAGPFISTPQPAASGLAGLADTQTTSPAPTTHYQQALPPVTVTERDTVATAAPSMTSPSWQPSPPAATSPTTTTTWHHPIDPGDLPKSLITPSGNIRCLLAAGESQLRCVIGQHDFPIEPCNGQPGATVWMDLHGSPTVSGCADDSFIGATLEPANYDSDVPVGDFECEVRRTGVRCTNQDQHGFHLAKASLDLF